MVGWMARKAKADKPKRKSTPKVRIEGTSKVLDAKGVSAEDAVEFISSDRAKAKANEPDGTGKKVDTRFKSGAEWTGNAAGRPRGSRNKLEEDFVSDLCEAWKTHGKIAIDTLATTDIPTFVKVVASVIPKESKVTVDVLDTMSAHELRDFITGEIEALGISHKAPPVPRGKGISRSTGRSSSVH